MADHKIKQSSKESARPDTVEQQLIESREIFKTVFDHSPAAIIVTDMQERIVTWNAMAESILGMARADLFNRPIKELFFGSEYKRFCVLYQRHKGFVTEVPTRINAKSGSLVYINAAASVFKDSHGQPQGIINIWHDTSSQRRMADDLRQSENTLRVILDNSAAAITMTDAQERIVSWNKFAEKLFGMTKEDLYLRPISSLYPPQEWKNIRSMNIRQSGFKHHLETKVVHKDGHEIDVDLSVNILKDRDNNIIGSVGITQDITEQKRVREMLLQAKLSAEEANSAKSVFLAKMSHEVRSPMNAIIGMLDLTLDTELNEEQRDNLKVAKDAADNLLSLINDILDLSRAQAGKVVLEEIEMNAPDIVKNVCKGLSVLARNKGIDLIWNIDGSIPRLLVGDPVRLRQVLVNLVNNAVKFTNKGKVEVNAKMESLTSKDCMISFEIIDQGIGIPKKNLTTLFDVFTEAHNTTARRYGGTRVGDLQKTCRDDEGRNFGDQRRRQREPFLF